jgi:hypothetical protein
VRPVVIAFLLGAAGLGIAAGAALIALGVVADGAGWSSFRVGIGPVPVLTFERRGGTTESTLGSGLGLIALAGGLLNAAAACFLLRRRRLH